MASALKKTPALVKKLGEVVSGTKPVCARHRFGAQFRQGGKSIKHEGLERVISH